MTKQDRIKKWMLANWGNWINEDGEICMTHLSEGCADALGIDLEEEIFEAALEVCQQLRRQGVCDEDNYVFPE